MPTPPPAGRRPFVIPHLQPNTWRQYLLIMSLLLTLLVGLIFILLFRGKPSEARELSRQAEALLRQEKAADAEAPARQALRLAEARLKPEHADLLPYLATLARIEEALGKRSEAEGYYKRALAIREKTNGPYSISLQPSLNGLGKIARADGRHADAEAWFRRSVGIADRKTGLDTPETLVSLHGLAGALIAQGKKAEAEPHVRRAALALDHERADAPTFLDALAELYDQIEGKEKEAQGLRECGNRIRFKRRG